jgi:FtsH-binding integral membrane protein
LNANPQPVWCAQPSPATTYIMAIVTLYVSIFNLFTSLLHPLGFANRE